MAKVNKKYYNGLLSPFSVDMGALEEFKTEHFKNVYDEHIHMKDVIEYTYMKYGIVHLTDSAKKKFDHKMFKTTIGYNSEGLPIEESIIMDKRRLDDLIKKELFQIINEIYEPSMVQGMCIQSDISALPVSELGISDFRTKEYKFIKSSTQNELKSYMDGKGDFRFGQVGHDYPGTIKIYGFNDDNDISDAGFPIIGKAYPYYSNEFKSKMGTRIDYYEVRDTSGMNFDKVKIVGTTKDGQRVNLTPVDYDNYYCDICILTYIYSEIYEYDIVRVVDSFGNTAIDRDGITCHKFVDRAIMRPKHME